MNWPIRTGSLEHRPRNSVQRTNHYADHPSFGVLAAPLHVYIFVMDSSPQTGGAPRPGLIAIALPVMGVGALIPQCEATAKDRRRGFIRSMQHS
jgi:hypothetical protein